MTITGTDFAAGATVRIVGASATNVSVVSSTQITATTAIRGVAAVGDVQVVNPDFRSGSLAGAFTYIGVPGPGGLPPIPPGLSPELTSMLGELAAHIREELDRNEALVPANAHNEVFIRAKIAMLLNPTLGADIINNRRWVEQAFPIRVVAVFPLEMMRSEAAQAVSETAGVVPVLEGFFNRPYPIPVIRLWYGFGIGNSTAYMEDRTTYESRVVVGAPGTLPYDAILAHEAAHFYMGHETLNQFLELYAYNVRRTGSTDVSAWAFRRGWTPGLSTNAGIAALLDVYQLIGHDTMARAYRAIHPLMPPFGSPLSQAVLQTFVAQVPAPLQAQVAEKLARITF